MVLSSTSHIFVKGTEEESADGTNQRLPCFFKGILFITFYELSWPTRVDRTNGRIKEWFCCHPMRYIQEFVMCLTPEKNHRRHQNCGMDANRTCYNGRHPCRKRLILVIPESRRYNANHKKTLISSK